jgi:phosphomannomutase
MQKIMEIEPKIFKAYDIRGLAGVEITEKVAELVGRALVKYSGAERILVARDMRLSSPTLLKAIKSGITASGADIIDIGLATNPLFFFAVAEEFRGGGKGAGANVTASHNPKEYNGFKIVREDGFMIGESSGMEEIRDLVLAGKFKNRPPGKIEEKNPLNNYLDRILSVIPKKEVGERHVVFDAGNGMAGITLPSFIRAYDLQSENLFFDLNGNFPNHIPNPVAEETLVALKKKVIESGAELGVSFDGDADRVGFVDELGNFVRGDIMTAFLAREMLRRSPGSWVVATIPCGRIIGETVAASGGKLEIVRVGNPFVKYKMRELGAVFGGELSMHFMFRDMNYLESSELAVAIVLAALNREKKPLSKLIRPLLKYAKTPETNFVVKDKDAAFAIIAALEKKYSDGKINHTDGVRIDYPSWWFCARVSNTEPLVRLNLEADTEEEMKMRFEEVKKIINET